jgi:hypothetical protein
MVIVQNLDIARSPGIGRPFKTDAPLLIDSDAILAGALSFQRFATIAWKRPEIGEAPSGIQDFETLPRLSFKALKRPDQLAEANLSERLSR